MFISLEVDGRPRTYLLRQPPRRGPHPVVLVLHGAGATAAWMEQETQLSAAGLARGFLLVYPEGTPPQLHKSPRFLTNPLMWNDASPRAEQHDLPDDVAFLQAVLADLPRHSHVNLERVYVTGFSNGAGMAFRFVAEAASSVRGVAPVAGHCWLTELQLARPVPTFYLIGREDPLVPLAGGLVRTPWRDRLIKPPVAEVLDRWALGLGRGLPARRQLGVAGLEEWRYPGPPEHTAELIAQMVPGLGHHWPGGLGRLPERYGGPASDQVNGTAAILDFFAANGLE